MRSSAFPGASAKVSPKPSLAGFFPGSTGGAVMRGGSPGPSKVVTTQPETTLANANQPTQEVTDTELIAAQKGAGKSDQGNAGV